MSVELIRPTPLVGFHWSPTLLSVGQFFVCLTDQHIEILVAGDSLVLMHYRNVRTYLLTYLTIPTSRQYSRWPKAECIADDWRVDTIKWVVTDCSPDSAVVDFQPTFVVCAADQSHTSTIVPCSNITQLLFFFWFSDTGDNEMTKFCHSFRLLHNTIWYDTIEEFNVDSKAEYTA